MTAHSRFESGIRSPLDMAILERCPDGPIDGWTKLDEVPFDFDRRRVSVLAEKDGECILIIKGAPESVLSRVTMFDAGDGQAVALDAVTRCSLERMQNAQSACGHRLLAVAWKAMPKDCTQLRPEDERDLVMRGSASLSIRRSRARHGQLRNLPPLACG